MLCHGTVCVVGKIRALILQLSKSSIYSTKPPVGILGFAIIMAAVSALVNDKFIEQVNKLIGI
ncbi:TPA: colicin-like pore-forming protein [Escherichia coli]